MDINQRTHYGEHRGHGVVFRYPVAQCPRGESLALHRLNGIRKSHVLMILIGIVLMYLAFHATPAYAQTDCDPFESGTPQSSKKCPCSDDPNNKYYCASAVQYTVFEITEKVRALFLSILETIARVLWLAARFIANIAEALLHGQVWQVIREGILEQLQTVMGGSGGVLARVTGGGNGLFLVALLLGGLVMVFPLLGATRLVQADRAILWGVVLFALFIGGTQGFDLTNAIESLRIKMIETIAEGGNSDSLIDLVAKPVGASQDETQQLDTSDLLTLPRVMLQDHFIGLPEGSRCQGDGGGGDECQKYRVIAFETNIAGQDLEYMFAAVKYKPDVIDGRQKQYISGLVRMVVAVLAALVLLLFGIIFALLTAASLVLIIFFFAMLPLGFFEFGGAVLSGLMRQYTSVVGLSLFIAVMVRLMEGVTGTIFGAVSDFSDVLSLLTYLGMLLIVGLGLQMAVRTAWGLMDGTFTVLRASVQTVGSMAYAVGGGPLVGLTHSSISGGKTAASVAPNTAVKAAMISGAGLAEGLSETNLRKGAMEYSPEVKINNQVQDMKVNEVRVPVHESSRSASGNGDSHVSRIQLMMIAQTSDANQGGGLANPRQLDTQNSINRRIVGQSSYVQPDLTALADAEHAYFERHDIPKALAALKRAFGSRAMADEILGAYQIQGNPGAWQVRHVIVITLASVDDLVQDGQTIYDEKGSLTPACQSAVLSDLQKEGLYNENEPHISAFVGRLAGAALRSPVDAWEDPQAARKLARAILDLDQSEVQIDDPAAQHRLHDTVKHLGWDEDHLADAFSAFHRVEQNAERGGSSLVEALLQEWHGDPEFAKTKVTDLREAARLVTLVASQASILPPHPIPSERADLLAPLSEIRSEAGEVVVSAPYSAGVNRQFKDRLPIQDYYWDADRAEWHIASSHEAVVREILGRVGKENGWQRQVAEQAEETSGAEHA